MAKHELVKLSVLPVNKTVVFYSPLEGERDVLVRTGTIAGSGCFYHCLLHAYSRDYVSMDDRGRKKLVSKLRSSLAKKIDRDRWERMSSGAVGKIPFQDNVAQLLSEFYDHILNNRPGKSRKVRKVIRSVVDDERDNPYKVILSMVSLDDFEKRILPEAYERTVEKSIRECRDRIAKQTDEFYRQVFEEMKGKLDRKRIEFCVKKLVKMVKEVCSHAETAAFEEYMENLKGSEGKVDGYAIGLVSNRFNRDVFFIDASTRMPYTEGGTDNVKKRKSIIVMATGDSHYEVVGRLLPGNRVQREFSADDPLITRIRTFVCEPERVPKEYPTLVPYLSDNLRRRIGMRQRSERDYEHSSGDSSEDSDSSEEDRLDSLLSSEQSEDSSRSSRSHRRYKKSPGHYDHYNSKKVRKNRHYRK